MPNAPIRFRKTAEELATAGAKLEEVEPLEAGEHLREAADHTRAAADRLADLEVIVRSQLQITSRYREELHALREEVRAMKELLYSQLMAGAPR
jgi:hypothetical protein